jgi:uncharacterized radical SAM protein YgiQ
MANQFKHTDWLPTSAKEVKALGWESIDVILFSGDAYVDHPSFGIAVIGRLLQKQGLNVAIVPQPNWRDDLRDFKKLGTPNLFFGVSAGNMDSMINHYTAAKRLRSDDAYTPGGKPGQRPDYACTVYSKILKQLYPNVPIVIGGIEASLRRLCHYDYWSDTLKPSILIESGADLLIYGMAEKTLKELVKLLKQGVPLKSIRNISQTAYIQPASEKVIDSNEYKTIQLHSFEKCKADKKAYAENFRIFEEESNKIQQARLVEQVKDKLVVVNPSYSNLSQDEIDEPYDLPYTRLPHPRYQEKGDIPAYEMIKNSINIHRGCFGGCSFCTISAHQGKFVLSRSEQSVLKEVDKLVNTPGFKGTITDLGGPSANMYQMKGRDLTICEKCKKPSCIFPTVCKNLNADHTALIDIYKKVSDVKGVNNVYIGSGVRYDLIYDLPNEQNSKKAKEYLRQLVSHHVSGRLKVAPEHTSDLVLKIMRKPSFLSFKKLAWDFDRINQDCNKKQQLIPYFISSHPGSKLENMAELAAETRKLNFKLEQVQDFTPTPMTLSTCMYYTGFDPYTGEKVYTPHSSDDKKAQLSFFFWYKPEMKQQIKKMLEKLGRSDLFKKLT